MIEEKTRSDVCVRSPAPRWIGIALVVLAVVSLAGLGVGWSASNRSKTLEQSLTAQTQQDKQNEDVLSSAWPRPRTPTRSSRRAERHHRQDEADQTELSRARSQTTKIKEDDAKELADLQNNVNGAAGDQGQRR